MASNSDRRSSSSGSDRRGGSDTRRNATNRQQGGQTSRTPASRQGNRGSGQQQSASQRAGAFSRSLDPTIRSQFSMYGQNSSSFSQRRGTATWAERTARLSERTEREPQSRSVREPQSRTDRQVIDFESRLRARQQSRNQQSRLEIRNSFDAQVAREERYRRDREAAQRASTAPDSSRSVRPGAMHPSVRAARSMQLREQERVLSTSTRTQPLSPASSRYVSSHQQARSTQETRSLMGGRAGTSATQRIHENIRQRMGDGRSIRDIEAQKHRLELRKTILGIAARVAVVLLILGALVGGGVALYNSSLFSIEEVSVSGNRYMSSSEVMGLAAVPDDATMLRIDTKEIERRLETSPWIEKASVSRSLPHGLRIEVTERQISLCVKMPIDTNTGVVRYWALSADGIWLASMDQDEMDAVNNQIEVQERLESAALAGIRDQAVDTVTIAVEATEGMELPETDEPTYSGNDGGDDVTVPNVSFAQGMGTAGTAQTPQVTSLSTGVLSDPAKQDFVHAMQVEGIAPTVVPQVGDVCADPGLVNALEIMDGLSVSFRSRVALIHAESVESTSLVLDNGIEVAFGSSKDVKDKERVVTKLLKEHEGAIAYINVRVVSDPTWRGIDG